MRGNVRISRLTNVIHYQQRKIQMKVKVFLKSRPGLYERYNGSVIINIANEEIDDDASIKSKAVEKLRQTSFPDRDMSMWVMESWERL